MRPRTRLLVLGGLGLSLLLLLLHSVHYLFLTDDAFISFRYARNLSEGFGLVFNPGHEPVEGYSNFLFVLVLAAFHRIGLAPETMAHVLTFAGTIALWATVAWFAVRRLPAPGREWIAVLPLFLLAATRSVAVWSTSGLETRWFESLLVGGALRMIVEVESELAGSRRRALAVWLFALATWTRPDGLLISCCSFATAAAVLWRHGRLDLRSFALRLLPFAVIVGGHFLWRHAYYGYWLPNTYYAKVGGRAWWDSGLMYGAAFVLEYGVVLWLPLLVAGVLHHRRAGTAHVPAVFGAVVLPHWFYVTAIGGDHFEYRPLDLYFPFLYLLLADGVRGLLERRPRLLAAVGAWIGLLVVGLWELPSQSHRQFSARYLPGFPGTVKRTNEAQEFLDPARSLVFRWPLLEAVARAHRECLRWTSAHFVGLRQEEHRLFLASVEPDGHVLRKAIESGLLPADVHVAMGCVGAIPYHSDVRTLDMLGLTDATVAHQPPRQQRAMAHDRQASVEYAQSRGVDLWAADGVHTVFHVASASMWDVVIQGVTEHVPFEAADLGDGWYVVAYLPQGREQAARRMPRLRFQPVGDPAFVLDYVRRALATMLMAGRAEDGVALVDRVEAVLRGIIGDGASDPTVTGVESVLLQVLDDHRGDPRLAAKRRDLLLDRGRRPAASQLDLVLAISACLEREGADDHELAQRFADRAVAAHEADPTCRALRSFVLARRGDETAARAELDIAVAAVRRLPSDSPALSGAWKFLSGLPGAASWIPSVRERLTIDELRHLGL
ncbi:MAG: hypothetical protein JNL12_00515 [Planctomycetes bacterium]|nr:hypothetical protein [Planctomycetota bacterium]